MENTTDNPLVSLIVRTKDRPKLLKRALQSIAAQTYRPIEVVLVNDGGCDLDIEELKGILGDVSLHYIRLEKNVGRACAGNVGIENAKGEYVGFLDDDDIYFSCAIKLLVEAALLRDNKVIYGKVICRKYVTEDGTTESAEAEANIIMTMGEPFDSSKLIFENFIPINSLLIPKDLFSIIGKLDSEFEIYEDWDMLLRLAEVSQFHFIDAAIAEYSVYDSALITGKGGPEKIKGYREKLLEKHMKKATAKDFIAYIQFLSNRIVEAKDKEIQEILTALHKVSMEYQKVSPMLEDREQQLNMLKERISIMNGDNKRKEKEIAKLTDQERELRNTLNCIVSSHSWKMTKPFRTVGAALKKTLSKIKQWN